MRLVREYALIVHLLDRSMCAAIGLRYGAEAVKELAIEEWAGASPVYGDRLRQIMNIEGDGVSAIFKVLQLDPGFPHHYLDVHYEVVDETHGYFELAYCGALMDAEPFGDVMVTNMCHHIEDGTFDVTAQAINPKAHVRHVHRPPRVPSRPRAALPLGGRDRGRDRDAAREGHHEDHARHDGGDLRLPRHEGRHAARPCRHPRRGGATSQRRDRVRSRWRRPATASELSDAAEQPVRRHLSERQASVMERLVEAAAAEAEERGYADDLGADDRQASRRGAGHRLHLLLRQGPPARRGPLAAACSRRRISSTSRSTLPERVAETARTMGFASMGRQAVGGLHDRAAWATVPTSSGCASRIGVEIGRRLAAALGAGAVAADARAAGHLHGRAHQRRHGAPRFDAVPPLMAEATALHDRRHRGAGGPVTTVAPLAYSPYDYAIHEDPYPTYAQAARARRPSSTTAISTSSRYARHADVLAAFRDVDHYSNAYGVSLDPAAFGPDAHRAMSFLAMDPPTHTRMRSIVGKSFTPRRVAAMEAGIRRMAVSHLRGRARGRQRSTSSATSPGGCPWT